MRRRTLFVAAGLCILLVVLSFGFLVQSEERVQIGMQANEVEEILGGRGLLLTFRNDQDLKDCAESLMMQAPPGAVMMRWDRRHSSVHVMFDSDGKVAGVYYPRGLGRYLNMIQHSIGLD